jgi:molecular chaperone DnaK
LLPIANCFQKLAEGPLMSDEIIIGIDLGTTNSVVAVLENDQPRVILNSEGSTRTPSVVSFTDKGEILIGEIARRQSAVNPSHTVTSIKRLMGRTEADLEALGLKFPFSFTSHDGEVVVRIGEKGYTPPQISAMILQKLKKSAEEYLGETVTKAIVTVPAYFDDHQRHATLEAGRLAGLEVLRLINEPTAAAMAYGLGRSTSERVVIYDFGGGTFDLTVMEISEGTFQVLTSTGDTHLGGDDIDDLLVQKIVQDFSEKQGTEFIPDAMALRRLKDAAEKAKCELSVTRQTIVHLPFMAYENGAPVHLERTITREDLESLIYPMIERTIDFCKTALEDCELRPDEIDKVILVGGTTRIPLICDLIEDFFGVPAFKGINPDEIVAMGAATQAGVLAGKLKEVLLLDVTPHSLGVEVHDNKVSRVVEKNSTIPIKAARLFTTTEDGQQMVMVHVIQGESEKATENRSLGKFTLSGIQDSKAGVPRVQVVFYINADGIVEVSAEDLATKQQASMNVMLGGDDSTGPKRQRTSRKPRRRPAAKSNAPEVLAALNPTQSQASRTRPGTKSGLIVTNLEAESHQRLTMEPVVLEKAPDKAAEEKPEEPTQPPTEPLTFAQQQPAHTFEQSLAKLSEPAKFALRLTNEHARGPEAIRAYTQALPDLERYVSVHPGDAQTVGGFIRVLIYAGRKDEARNILLVCREEERLKNEQLADLFDLFLEFYPDDDEAVAGRAETLSRMGLMDAAINDLEKVCSEERGTDAHVRRLIQLYQDKLNTAEDSLVQYKLVKLLVREKRLDEAIAVLQQLSHSSSYGARAIKILGLCYWQKGMHYLAWQKFQQLPLSDEIKDFLYRLSAEKEDTEQLLNAKVVLQHLHSIDPEYRDVQTRLRKVENLIKLHANDSDGNKTPSPFLTFRDSRFVILEEINRGSMGIVYRAKDTVLEEIVALKVLNDYMMTDPVAVERFKREARAAKKLSHPNIVRIHDMFEYGNKRLLSMEYIEGEDLKKILKERKTLPADEVVTVARAVCDALAYAHQMNIVHRDIKPANIMIAKEQRIKVTDFGIAKFLLAGPESTRSGSQILGTPLYMSPEQIRGDQVDVRSDIYSFGATLYEMASGRPPFPDGNIEYHHLHTPPPPLPATVNEALRVVVMRCLEKQQTERFQTITELKFALEEVPV